MTFFPRFLVSFELNRTLPPPQADKDCNTTYSPLPVPWGDPPLQAVLGDDGARGWSISDRKDF